MKTNIKTSRIPALIQALLVLTVASFSACKDDDVEKPVEPVNQNENPSHIKLTLVNMANLNDTITANWNDADGAAGTSGAITIDSVLIANYSDYKLQISIENRTVSPVLNLTSEIAEEKNVHQFFFKPAPMNLLTVDNLDMDDKNLPFGLNSELHTVLKGSGTLQIDLDHFDSVVKTGTNRSGDTDISIVFPVRVK